MFGTIINNHRDTLKKLSLIKYDPMVNQHVVFNEVKMPSGKKRTWLLTEMNNKFMRSFCQYDI